MSAPESDPGPPPAFAALFADCPPPTAFRQHRVPHPSSHSAPKLLAAWRAAVTGLRGVVTPDAGVRADGPNYAAAFAESDYAAIPRRDLPFGVPSFAGDDAWVRAGSGRSSVSRPDEYTIEWNCPRP